MQAAGSSAWPSELSTCQVMLKAEGFPETEDSGGGSEWGLPRRRSCPPLPPPRS